jgi:16S rRNA (uracil1498-N3)-methyltransferase
MTARFFVDLALRSGDAITLPDRAARHVQVLRLQPGDAITLFNSQGGEFAATVERMGRSDVQVMVTAHDPVEREMRRAVHLVVGMPANERMDWFVEKATELGVTSITPLMAERSVLRLKGERADKKVAHWRGVAIAACEQCGRNRVPVIHDIATFSDWAATLDKAAAASTRRLLLSLRAGTQAWADAFAPAKNGVAVTLLSGPEGGLSTTEENAAIGKGFVPLSLGARILRAETAPLACLALLGMED